MRQRSDDRSHPPLRTTDLFVLASLVKSPQHGYGLSQAITAQTGGRVRVRAGDLYRVLYRMHEAGLIEEVPAKSRPEGDERRTYYRITAEGRRVAREQAQLLTEVCAAVLGRKGEVLP